MKKRKKALAQVRRQAAREELARNSSKLKAEVARSIASVSTDSSITDPEDRKKTALERLQTLEVDNINAIEIPPRQAPVSPLKSRDDAPKTTSRKAEARSKLKCIPLGSSQISRTTERIRAEPAGRQSFTLGSEENTKNGIALRKTKPGDAGSSVSDWISRLNNDQFLAKQCSFGKTTSESGSVPLKSRSNHRRISSTEKHVPKVDSFYPLATLQSNTEDGIDGAHREKYLSPEDF